MLALLCVFGTGICIRISNHTIATEDKTCHGYVWATRECAHFTANDSVGLGSGLVEGDAIGRRWGDFFLR